jgi:hypothetical protein
MSSKDAPAEALDDETLDGLTFSGERFAIPSTPDVV